VSSPISFVLTRHVYDSYVDMRRLIELADFPSIYVDEVDTSKEGVFIFITMNGEVEPHIRNQDSKPRNAHLILWNLERPSGSAGSVGNYARRQRELIYNRIFDEVWLSDRRMADETQLRFVVLGSHPELGHPSDDKRYAFCHMSYEVPRRTGIYKYFTPESIGHNCWPPERDEVLRQSKFALNIHQDVHPFQEPLRLALFAAYGLPIISETIMDMYPWSDEVMITTRYDDLTSRLRTALSEDYEPYREMGLRARQRMTEEYEFGKCVREAVSQSLDKWR
jgi:hypothetical protein